MGRAAASAASSPPRTPRWPIHCRHYCTVFCAAATLCRNFTYCGGVCPARRVVQSASADWCRTPSGNSCRSLLLPRQSPTRCRRTLPAGSAWGRSSQTCCRETRRGSPTAACPPAACRCSCTHSTLCRHRDPWQSSTSRARSRWGRPRRSSLAPLVGPCQASAEGAADGRRAWWAQTSALRSKDCGQVLRHVCLPKYICRFRGKFQSTSLKQHPRTQAIRQWRERNHAVVHIRQENRFQGSAEARDQKSETKRARDRTREVCDSSATHTRHIHSILHDLRHDKHIRVRSLIHSISHFSDTCTSARPFTLLQTQNASKVKMQAKRHTTLKEWIKRHTFSSTSKSHTLTPYTDTHTLISNVHRLQLQRQEQKLIAEIKKAAKVRLESQLSSHNPKRFIKQSCKTWDMTHICTQLYTYPVLILIQAHRMGKLALPKH